MNCTKCNAGVADDAVFCNSCGYKLSGGTQVLSTNAMNTIQEKSTKLFNRTTYSMISKVLFFSVLVAMVGAILGLFSVKAGAYVFAVPLVIMYVIVIYRAFMTFVDVNALSDEMLAKELRHMLTYFAYSLFLLTLAAVVVGIAIAMSSYKYTVIILFFNGLLAASGGLAVFSILIAFLIFMAASVRVKDVSI